MLCPENFLHLADFLLDFSAYLFALAFGCQVGIVRRLSNLLFNTVAPTTGMALIAGGQPGLHRYVHGSIRFLGNHVLPDFCFKEE